MDNKALSELIKSAGLVAIACLILSTSSRAQSPSPSPVSETGGSGFTVNSSVELGVRGLEVNGDHEKYRSDLNYGNGFRLFDSSFLLENKSKVPHTPFDSLYVSASGWGADPTGSFRMNMDKTGLYKFQSSVRRVNYFNSLNKFAVNEATLRGQHNSNTLHHFGDLDLTIFPESSKFRVKLGYSFNKTDGPGSYTLRFRSDQFQVGSFVKTKSDDLHAGVEGKVLGFNVGINYGRRFFRDRTYFFVDSLNLGNQTASNTSSINRLSRLMPTDGTTDFVNFFVQRTFAQRLDLAGRVVYAESNSTFDQSDIIRGLNSGTPNNIITLDQINVSGESKRPQTRADLGLTYRVTDGFRISNTLVFDQFNIGGGNRFSELLGQTTSVGNPVPNTLTNTLAHRTTAYRRLTDTIEADYQVNRRFGFNVGYRFTQRKVVVDGFDRNLISGVLTAGGAEELENTTHSVLAGVKVKPTTNWSVYADLERGESDNVFTRLANNDYFNFRIRSITNLKRFTINLSGISRNNDSPGRTIRAATGSGSSTIAVPEFESTANTRTRYFSASVDWNASNDYTIGGGYTYNHQDSKADVIVPVGTPLFPSNRFLQGISEYYVRDSFVHFDVSARPLKWMSIYASYRVNDDKGQGDRVIARPQDIITSYPIRYQTPEVRLAFRITRSIDWNVGYQYYDYKERPVQLSFINQPFIAQNYSAHLPYTSLRIYFGGAAVDR